MDSFSLFKKIMEEQMVLYLKYQFNQLEHESAFIQPVPSDSHLKKLVIGKAIENDIIYLRVRIELKTGESELCQVSGEEIDLALREFAMGLLGAT